MRWRLTGRYLFSILLIVLFVVCINGVMLVGLLFWQSHTTAPFFSEPVESFVREFKQYVQIDEGRLTINSVGKEVLKQKNAWIQVLNEQGEEQYAYRAPKTLPTSYSPVEIVQMYKYEEVDADTTVFMASVNRDGQAYSYFIGVVDPNINRDILSYNTAELRKSLNNIFLLFLMIDSLIAVLIGYVFSQRLTKPVHKIVDDIKRLASKDYNVVSESRGIYREVAHNVHDLSTELKAAEVERKKLDRLKEEWIANISHDMKTPLASIQGFAEMMKDKDYNFPIEEMREYAEIIEQKSLYIKEVIDDLNLTTRLKNKQMSLNKQSVNIVSLVRNIVIDLLNDPKYQERSITFDCKEEGIFLAVDELLLRRALSNLIYNAVVHNDPDTNVTVKVEREEGKTAVYIEDNGKGMSKEELNHIFSRYYRGTNTGESHKGSGLGTAIAKDIIEAHQGVIMIKSILGEGTTIRVEL
ncbi:HAMP domain-containing sensor histidine kinase [Bacillus sp. REN10]|uniref:sensor histidine kinase n=1 Tax=Bacillus sp. REN10 TaxID=2782541 RepID=UPI00193C09F3|nr:HAMP domain-containing sensor histidine kinase [Bacillus sp. REN10]